MVQLISPTDVAGIERYHLRLDAQHAVTRSSTATATATRIQCLSPVFILTPVVDLVSFVVEKLGLPLLNSKIAQGLPLPSSPQVQLNKTQVAIRQEYLVVASDVQVKPT